jgi:cardiolipin synthase
MSLQVTAAHGCQWICAGDDIFPAMLAAIDGARERVLFETYIFSPGSLGQKFLEALVRAAQRGVKVKVLIDAFGSATLPWSFWGPLLAVGGEARLFNPLALRRFGIRDHRKMLICDQNSAFVGGFNIAPEYEGDGIRVGWFDLGIHLRGGLVAPLAHSFEEMFVRAEFRHKRFLALRNYGTRKAVEGGKEQLLLSGPGRVLNPIKRALREDLAHARKVRIIAAYFLPTRRIRRDLARVARQGGEVQLILAGKSDVPVSRLAAQSLYRRLLNAGVRIFEYQPQILHAKLIIIDDIVYVGSANLDQRSLNINYELMARFKDGGEVDKARKLFDERLGHCQEITRETWKQSRGIWARLKRRLAYFLLVRIDPVIARWQLRGLPD